MAISKEMFRELAGRELDEVLKELHFPAAAYERVAQVALTTTDERLPQLAAAVASGDRAETQRIAHELKGVFANLRLEALARPLADMERTAKDGGSLGVIRGGLDELSSGFEIFKIMCG
ncbi:MAG: Hpt domain-containing protein [Candidatus Omnitrophica bacterium]|nr:Hpt domain-containing protein [Candidatus Omnitrophota bacterium]